MFPSLLGDKNRLLFHTKWPTTDPNPIRVILLSIIIVIIKMITFYVICGAIKFKATAQFLKLKKNTKSIIKIKNKLTK